MIGPEKGTYRSVEVKVVAEIAIICGVVGLYIWKYGFLTSPGIMTSVERRGNSHGNLDYRSRKHKTGILNKKTDVTLRSFFTKLMKTKIFVFTTIKW